jgi:hypothetical protein
MKGSIGYHDREIELNLYQDVGYSCVDKSFLCTYDTQCSWFHPSGHCEICRALRATSVQIRLIWPDHLFRCGCQEPVRLIASRLEKHALYWGVVGGGSMG